MPHVPDSAPHAAHDLELIAAHAAGDTDGVRLETAAALLAGCEDCARLHADLRAIALATSVLPAPVRRRDYRLTPEQAATLRPSGWRGLLAALAGPRFRLATPLGTGLATLGLAALLVAGLGSAPLAVTTSGGAAGTNQGGAGDDPAAGTTEGEAGGPIDIQAIPSAAAGAAPTDDVYKAAPGDPRERTSPSPAAGPAAAPEPLAVAGVLAGIAGIALLGLRRAGRRYARAP